MEIDKRPTSFRLDPELLKRAAHYAIDHDTTVQEMVEQGLRHVLGLPPEIRSQASTERPTTRTQMWPTDEEMKRIYDQHDRVVTPKGRYTNHIVGRGARHLDLRSESPNRKHDSRRITFDDIRNNAGTHWQIIQSLRQLVGLSNDA